MLATNPQLEIIAGGAAFFDGELHHFAYPFHVDGHEGVFRQNTRFDIFRQELARVVARQAEHRLRQVVGAEAEEVRDLGDFARLHGRARQFDHRADAISNRLPRFREHRFRHPIHLGSGYFQLFFGGDQRDHDLRMRGVAGFLGDGERALEDGAGLHFIDFGIGDAEAAATMAQHGVGLGEFGGAAAYGLHVHAHGSGHIFHFGLGVRQEFVQRRVEQTDRDRQTRHDGEQLPEVLALER